MKPILPKEIADKLPPEVLQNIYAFVPHYEKAKEPSPSLQKELARIQTITLKGKDNMYMKDLEDFLLY